MEKLTMKEKEPLNKIKLLKKERDTWKKACELACEDKQKAKNIAYSLILGKDNIGEQHPKMAQYYYKQAQKEMK